MRGDRYVLSFEGPDAYARAGGIASRITGLTQALAEAGFETHLWFLGNPDLPGHETRGQLHLHRWCQRPRTYQDTTERWRSFVPHRE